MPTELKELHDYTGAGERQYINVDSDNAWIDFKPVSDGVEITLSVFDTAETARWTNEQYLHLSQEQVTKLAIFLTQVKA